MFADEGGIKSVTLKVNSRRQTQRDAPRIIGRQSTAPVSPPAATDRQDRGLTGDGTTHAPLFQLRKEVFKMPLITLCHSVQDKSVEMS